MGKLIAVAGKGGTGKTTVAALVTRYLIQTGRSPVLVSDADPNYTLADAWGVKVEKTVGMMREEFLDERASIPAGMSKEAVLQRQLHASLHEEKDFDLMVMGRQEGPGCYCALNNIMRNFMDMLADDYAYVVVDNEAGMEHLSRRTTRDVDLLFSVCDHSVKAARAAARINIRVEELQLKVRKKFVILNRAPQSIADAVQKEIDNSGLELLVSLPEDSAISQADAEGSSLLALPAEHALLKKLSAALDPILT